MTREELVRECEAIGSDLTETARKRGITLPPWSDPYRAQREREASQAFASNMDAENYCYAASEAHRTLIVSEHRAKEERAKRERDTKARRRVLLGLDRGPDPRIILACDLLDPSRRAR